MEHDGTQLRLIPGCEYSYASVDGRIFSYMFGDVDGPFERKVQPSRQGYVTAVLCKDGKRQTFYVHTLVAITFLGERPIGHQVNHKSGVKTSNEVTNLEWVTPKQNIRHAIEMGLFMNDPTRRHRSKKAPKSLASQRVRRYNF